MKFISGIVATLKRVISPDDFFVDTPEGKTLILKNSAYQDINFGINPRNTGSGRPTLEEFVSRIQQFSFAVGDFADLSPEEMLHGWEEGSELEFHTHVGIKNSDIDDRGVRFELTYVYIDSNGIYQATAVEHEVLIEANLSTPTDLYFSFNKFTPGHGKIGNQVLTCIKRISAENNPEPTSNPFLLSIGLHYKINTFGSRTIRYK